MKVCRLWFHTDKVPFKKMVLEPRLRKRGCGAPREPGQKLAGRANNCCKCSEAEEFLMSARTIREASVGARNEQGRQEQEPGQSNWEPAHRTLAGLVCPLASSLLEMGP